MYIEINIPVNRQLQGNANEVIEQPWYNEIRLYTAKGEGNYARKINQLGLRCWCHDDG